MLGDVLEISATVNNAFNTSMEVGVQVLSMSPNGPRIHCRAYFTFVSLDHHGVKCKVPKVIPETEVSFTQLLPIQTKSNFSFVAV